MRSAPSSSWRGRRAPFVAARDANPCSDGQLLSGEPRASKPNPPLPSLAAARAGVVVVWASRCQSHGALPLSTGRACGASRARVATPASPRCARAADRVAWSGGRHSEGATENQLWVAGGTRRATQRCTGSWVDAAKWSARAITAGLHRQGRPWRHSACLGALAGANPRRLQLPSHARATALQQDLMTAMNWEPLVSGCPHGNPCGKCGGAAARDALEVCALLPGSSFQLSLSAHRHKPHEAVDTLWRPPLVAERNPLSAIWPWIRGGMGGPVRPSGTRGHAQPPHAAGASMWRGACPQDSHPKPGVTPAPWAARPETRAIPPAHSRGAAAPAGGASRAHRPHRRPGTPSRTVGREHPRA